MLGGSGHQVEPSVSRENWFHRLWTLLAGDEALPGIEHLSSERALHATTRKLVQVHHQVNRLQARHNLEMGRLAQAYHSLSGQAREALPQDLRQQLNRIESEYF
jgi:hypothetical protein